MLTARKLINMLEATTGIPVTPNEVKEGTIFCAVDYYSENLNRTFYQVVRKTAKSVVIQEIKSDNRKDLSGYDNSLPIADNFTGKPKTARLKPDRSINVDKYRTATIWTERVL